MLTVTADAGTRPNIDGKLRRFWSCKCDCGNTSVHRHANLQGGSSKSCGCAHHKKGSNSHHWLGEGGISGSKWTHIQCGAKSRNMLFAVTKQEAWAIFVKQGSKCALTGMPIHFAASQRESASGTASLDRIDSSKGYEVGNLQWVHKDVNLMKLDLTQAEFIAICRSVVAHADRYEPTNPIHNSPTGEHPMRMTTCH